MTRRFGAPEQRMVGRQSLRVRDVQRRARGPALAQARSSAWVVDDRPRAVLTR